MRLLFLLFFTSIAQGQLICNPLYNVKIDGYHLWQRPDILHCQDEDEENMVIACTIGSETPQPDEFGDYELTFENLQRDNNIRCNTSKNVWELKDINMDPMNELTFVENDENRFIDVYIDHYITLVVSISGTDIFHLLDENQLELGTNYTVGKNLFFRLVEILNWNKDGSWIRLYTTSIQPMHAGIWIFSQLKRTNTFYVNVKSNLTCSDNILTTNCNVKIPTMTELSCFVGQTFNKTSFENITCRIENIALVPTEMSNFHFSVNSQENERQVIECASDESNQTWTSNPIRYFQRVENVTKATTLSNLNKPNCIFMWITPKNRVVNLRHLSHQYMTEGGYGAYYGSIACGRNDCIYQNYVVNFLNQTAQPFGLPQTTLPSPTKLFQSESTSLSLIDSIFNKKIFMYMIISMVAFLTVFITSLCIFLKLKNRHSGELV